MKAGARHYNGPTGGGGNIFDKHTHMYKTASPDYGGHACEADDVDRASAAAATFCRLAFGWPLPLPPLEAVRGCDESPESAVSSEGEPSK